MARDEYDAKKWVASLNDIVQLTRGEKDGNAENGCLIS